MTSYELTAFLPLIILAAAPVMIMTMIAFRRTYAGTFALSLGAVLLAFLSLLRHPPLPSTVTTLLVMDGYARFFTGLILLAGLFVLLLSYDYLKRRDERREEFYILLITALLGAVILAASVHFASFFLGLEILSVSLYVLIAYQRWDERRLEAGIKYLILAAFSSAFLIFGMGLIYAGLGTMRFPETALKAAADGGGRMLWITGTALIMVGTAFKLAIVPFHLWVADVYEGAPAPVTALIAAVSKGAVFAVLFRYFTQADRSSGDPLLVMLMVVSVASMFAGNLLALFQANVKRLLAYSSIAHMGYLLLVFPGTGNTAAALFYLAAYFITIIGAFGVVSVLSGPERDADRLDDYRGLFFRRPWLAGIFTLMLLSLAGIPLTAGFMGKFFVLTSGVKHMLLIQVLSLVVTSAIGLFYYLRIIVALYQPLTPPATEAMGSIRVTGRLALAILTVLLLWLGIYPAPVLEAIAGAGALG
jgi:NADH-quinone oxidoreductase subunit N